MKLRLAYWNRKWQSVSYDPSSGKGRLELMPLGNKPVNGWGYRKNRTWLGVYVESGRLVFQYDSGKCEISDEITCEIQAESGSDKKFVLKSGGELVFQTSFKPVSDSLLSKLDVARDHMDETMEDFFVWLYLLWLDKNWQKDFIAIWS